MQSRNARSVRISSPEISQELPTGSEGNSSQGNTREADDEAASSQPLTENVNDEELVENDAESELVREPLEPSDCLSTQSHQEGGEGDEDQLDNESSIRLPSECEEGEISDRDVNVSQADLHPPDDEGDDDDGAVILCDGDRTDSGSQSV